jgi:hypothetical protein
MNCCPPFNTTEIEFSNLAIKLIPPHMAFQNTLPYSVIIDFGVGAIPTASFQGIGTNDTDNTNYLIGGGAITLPTISNVIKGSIEIKGILFFSGIFQDEISKYNGSVSLTTYQNKIHKNHTNVKIEGTLSGLGIGIFNNTTLSGSLFGEGNVSINCGIRKFSFPNGSISLILEIPIGI